MSTIEQEQIKNKQKFPYNIPKNPRIYDNLIALQDRADFIRQQLSQITQIQTKRLTQAQKDLRKELHLIDMQIKRIRRDISKFSAIQDAAKKIGKDHGNITLNGTLYHW